MTERTICCVYTQPLPGREAEYNEWYDRRHLQDVLRVPGALSAQRFDPVDDEPDGDRTSARYLALYEIEGDPQGFLTELRARFGRDEMPSSEALDMANLSITFWKAHGGRCEVV